MDDDASNNERRDGDGDESKSMRPFQDDVTIDDSTIDPLMVEENDDPTEDLQIPASEFRAELDQYADSSGGRSESMAEDDMFSHGTADDRREMIEDMDENDEKRALAVRRFRFDFLAGPFRLEFHDQ